MSHDWDNKRKCRQQQNSQSQSCTSSFSYGYGVPSTDQLSQHDLDLAIAAAQSLVKKHLKVWTKADDDSNAQGQGQICQADFNDLFTKAEAEVEE